MHIPFEITGSTATIDDPARPMPKARVPLSSGPTACAAIDVNGYRGSSGSTVIHVTLGRE
jgi:hypothetical protein